MLFDGEGGSLMEYSMSYVAVARTGKVAILNIERPPVNALNESVVSELRHYLEKLERDSEVAAIMITGTGKFFSFGFDIPEFLSFSKDEFKEYLIRFTNLYRYIFEYPKPVVAALNGHTIAGGCMLALACDYRVMVTGRARIALNEISFGSSVFAGSTDILRFWVGNRNASTILYSGSLFSAEEAKDLGLVHQITTTDNLPVLATEAASDLAAKNAAAFSSIKSLLRKSVTKEIARRERRSIDEFVDLWYSAETRANLKQIKIFSGQ